MFAGGMAIGVPGFMPAATADLTVTDGMLSVSSTNIQGAAILEIVVNDPDFSDTTVDLNSGPTVNILGTSYITSQAANGKWYLYLVDDSVATDLDNNTSGYGMEYGYRCTTGLGTGGTASILASGTNAWATVITTSGTTAAQAGSCLDIDNALAALDDTVGTTYREDLTAAVLQGAPSLSNHNDKASTDSGYDLGQRLHNLNASGYGSWPYILSLDLSASNIISYGSDSITVNYGNTDSETDVGINNPTVADGVELHVWFKDPALNIDPTTADVWIFDLNQESTATFANNSTSNTAMTLAILGSMGCSANCHLTVDDASTAPGQISGYDSVIMTESGANTGVFESWNADGTSELQSVSSATADKQHTFKYGGNAADMIIAYNDAVISMDAGSGDWGPVTTATITVVDNDLNKNPTSAETLSIGNASSVIPTIKMGTPLTLAGGSNTNLQSGDTNLSAGGGLLNSVSVGEDVGQSHYGVTVYNTTDHSERLILALNGTEYGSAGLTAATATWINVTTGHSRGDLVNLPGTVVLSYDVSGPADLMSSTDIDVYITDSGSNATNHTEGTIAINTAGNVKAGVYDLDDGTYYLKSPDITAADKFGGTSAETNLITVAFQITHAAGDDMDAGVSFAIAADFCNFDQNNGSLVHNCIYRLAAEETGDDTGVFEGTVEYITLNNSTTGGSISGEHDGNDHEVEGLLTGVGGDALIVVLMDAVSGSDAVRVMYNDTDALQGATKRGASLDTVTHTGTVDLDSGTYAADDMATITIVDADLNQDSSVRDIYQNSSTTFGMTITKKGSTTSTEPFSATMVIIETEVDSGVFVGTFKVPNRLGADMELTYYESKDAGSNAVSYYDTATIQSTTGTISLDRSVYPVPFGSADLRTGSNGESLQTESGNVTAWITVTDVDFTSDTLTTGSTTAAGTILVKLIEGSTTSTCFTAGSTSSQINRGADGSEGSTSTSPEELGPLTEISPGSSSYEVKLVIDEIQNCGSAMRTVGSGDILQVEYVDTANDAGGTGTSYDSSTFDLRTGSLSVDKDVYVLGSDMVITLTDPDLNLDSASTESYAMSIIEWDSAADSSELLATSTASNTSSDFAHNPSAITETGSDTGVFQTVTTLPTSTITSTTIKYGESVTLTYVDVGLSGETSTEDSVLDVEAYFSISNFGAIIELDKAVYNWTDTVYFTITSPDHNVNTAAEESIGTSTLPIQVSTRVGKLCTTGDKTYFADETGIDTGVFTGEVALKGYNLTQAHNTPSAATSCGSTSDGGTLATSAQADGVSVSYEYNDATVVVASAAISFNIGEASFDTSAASAGGSALLTVTDPDENTNNTIVDTFNVAVFSDSDSGGFTLVMNETDEDTGVFEGTVFFTDSDATSGTNLRVSEGDTVTAEYDDKTLPGPYTDSDTLTLAATLTIGTAFPPLERAPAANARVVDAFGSSVAEVSVDQQVQIAADVSNGQSSDQAFAYLVQVQDENGVTVSLAWITGSLTAGQSMSPALSWTPSSAGSYTATVFVWESVDNPTALSPTTSVTIDVV
uniref:RTX toxin, Ca2+-binding protein n=1 Tax=uncultured marine thaumarchaeote KM3_63_D09 TaxID=1456219 RepID=A0A075HCN3_9ARCH|nr:RTX toxin, Ca2+-binding protein [uncultured marine thaumarchaeote KM3_63_D09]